MSDVSCSLASNNQAVQVNNGTAMESVAATDARGEVLNAHRGSGCFSRDPAGPDPTFARRRSAAACREARSLDALERMNWYNSGQPCGLYALYRDHGLVSRAKEIRGTARKRAPSLTTGCF